MFPIKFDFSQYHLGTFVWGFQFMVKFFKPWYLDGQRLILVCDDEGVTL